MYHDNDWKWCLELSNYFASIDGKQLDHSIRADALTQEVDRSIDESDICTARMKAIDAKQVGTIDHAWTW